MALGWARQAGAEGEPSPLPSGDAPDGGSLCASPGARAHRRLRSEAEAEAPQQVVAGPAHPGASGGGGFSISLNDQKRERNAYGRLPVGGELPSGAVLGLYAHELRDLTATMPGRSYENKHMSACDRRGIHSTYYCSCRRSSRSLPTSWRRMRTSLARALLKSLIYLMSGTNGREQVPGLCVPWCTEAYLA